MRDVVIALATGELAEDLEFALGQGGTDCVPRVFARSGDQDVPLPDALQELSGDFGRDDRFPSGSCPDRSDDRRRRRGLEDVAGSPGDDRFDHAVLLAAGEDEHARGGGEQAEALDRSRGDRLVLRTTVFGSQLLSLRRSFNVVANSDPQPRCHCASLLLDTSTGVLSFDRDGTGPISDQVIAKLPGLRTIRPGWVQITR